MDGVAVVAAADVADAADVAVADVAAVAGFDADTDADQVKEELSALTPLC